MKVQPMISVHDVGRASRWYEAVLGLRSAHGGDEYDQLVNENDELVLQLHRWDAHEHPLLGDPDQPARGNGAVLWFETASFDEALARITVAEADVADGPLDNPLARHREIWLRDPDGYVVVISGAFGTL
jgi:catechol 2,3-dioxygenase-like lactoylglutathione lyase family enzyme